MDSHDSSPLSMRLGSSGNLGSNNGSSSNSKNNRHKPTGNNTTAKPTSYPTKSLSQVDRLRQWRQDALMQHQYKTAEYVGDKILTLTSDISDAYWLAKIHFASGNYGRAHIVLTSRPEFNNSLQCRYLAGLSLCNMGQWESALEVVGESNDTIVSAFDRLGKDPVEGDDLSTGLVDGGADHVDGVNLSESVGGDGNRNESGATPSSYPSHNQNIKIGSIKVNSIIPSSSQAISGSTYKSAPPNSSHSPASIPFSSSSSAAAARSAIPLIIKSSAEPSYSTAPIINSTPNPSTPTITTSLNSDSFGFIPSSSTSIKIEASLCFLRGQIYTNDNNFDRAKECYREAVKIDAKCYEAFDQLITNNLMSPQEEWDLLRSLDFEKSAGSENAELMRALYSIRLGKYVNVADYKESERLLKDHYGLAENPDVLLSQADMLFIQNRHRECLKICENILSYDKFKFSVLPTYLACLYELGSRNRLFQLSHELVASSPQEAVSWQAVGVYYMAINKVAEARRYFSKASMMNPYFAPAWIGFAHTFAAEKEHEQAISAYSTAARLFPGSHLPTLFLGMQHLQLGNITLADDYLATSYGICRTDPLLLNEMGVVYYEKRDYETAEKFFLKALEASSDLESDLKSWLSIKSNLGHVYRRSENFDKSLLYFEEVLRVSPKESGIHTSMGLVNLMANRTMQAIDNFNDALSLSPGDPATSDLLRKALEQHSKSLELALDDQFTFDIPELEGLTETDFHNDIHQDSIHEDEIGNDSQMDIE